MQIPRPLTKHTDRSYCKASHRYGPIFSSTVGIVHSWVYIPPLKDEPSWLMVEQTPLKNIKVNWDDDIPNIWKHKKCSKPPTSVNVWSLYGIKIKNLAICGSKGVNARVLNCSGYCSCGPGNETITEET